MPAWLIVGAVAIVIALAAYAAWLWWRIHAQKRAREVHNAAVLADTEADLAQSLAILADSVLTGELNLSEGAIRLKVLLDHWYAPSSGQRDFPAIYRLYLLTATMPRGAERDTYPAREIRRLDREREARELAERDAILTEARNLQQRFGTPPGRAGLRHIGPVEAG